jgi:type II secretory pathway pseudopilin PulG
MRARRASERGITAIEAAVGIALAGSVLAVAVPSFVRNLSFSRLSEATDGLARIGAHAVAGAAGKPCSAAFPPSAPLTPASVPRGKPAVDPDPDPWNQPTWRALDFRPSPPGVAHSFAFAFDRTVDKDTSSFVAQAHGDLDGDGQTSTFEVRGTCEVGGAKLVPGMYVDREVE